MPSFEDRLTQLESVVERLERGELSLDDSVRLYEEGIKLSNACKLELEKAEGRMEVLTDTRPGRTATADLDEADESTPDDDADLTLDDEDEV